MEPSLHPLSQPVIVSVKQLGRCQCPAGDLHSPLTTVSPWNQLGIGLVKFLAASAEGMPPGPQAAICRVSLSVSVTGCRLDRAHSWVVGAYGQNYISSHLTTIHFIQPSPAVSQGNPNRGRQHSFLSCLGLTPGSCQCSQSHWQSWPHPVEVNHCG